MALLDLGVLPPAEVNSLLRAPRSSLGGAGLPPSCSPSRPRELRARTPRARPRRVSGLHRQPPGDMAGRAGAGPGSHPARVPGASPGRAARPRRGDAAGGQVEGGRKAAELRAGAGRAGPGGEGAGCPAPVPRARRGSRGDRRGGRRSGRWSLPPRPRREGGKRDITRIGVWSGEWRAKGEPGGRRRFGHPVPFTSTRPGSTRWRERWHGGGGGRDAPLQPRLLSFPRKGERC